jgi:hypothetical protein
MRGPIATVVAATLLGAVVTACAHLPPSAHASFRKARYFAEPRELTPSITDAIRRGHVIPGMYREQVWVVLGDAVRKTTFRSDRLIEIWLYRGHKLHQGQLHGDRADLFRLVFRDGILIVVEPL